MAHEYEFQGTLRLLGLTESVSRIQWLACAYCERMGLRFCVDFGVDNAVEKALNSIDARLAAIH